MKFFYITDMGDKQYGGRILIDFSGRRVICATPTVKQVYNVSTHLFALSEIDITKPPHNYLLPHLPKFVKNILQIQN